MIRFSNVTKRFRKARVLDDISLDIGLSERVALIGSNGAGKTTLIRCLLGEYTFDGQVSIEGRDPRQERTAVLGTIGFVPQLPPPLKMPVAQLIDFSAALCGTNPARIHELAQRLGLDLAPILTRPFVKLSGGMKQKLLIAIALGRDAKVLVMDEPAANLDPEARKIFFELLAERQEDVTMLISSHRLNEVSALVNRVIEMDMGKVVLDDRVADDVSLSGQFACRISIKRCEPAFTKAMQAWNFRDLGNGMEWEGDVPGPDRLRFMGMTSRYVALISDYSLREVGAAAPCAPGNPLRGQATAN
ncbi:MAG: ABC transporter related [Rhodocyclaceae bacterium]|nr:MAG: ABC transporter related [Rhodocyclaceae bacterium]TND02064.1 MAG: ABC transporter related [Rhodocyclaceae bacterium]